MPPLIAKKLNIRYSQVIFRQRSNQRKR